MAGLKKRSDGLYHKQLYLGKDSNGKNIYKSVYGKTKKETEQKADEIKIKLKKGIDVSASYETFGYWAEIWKSLKASDVSSGMMTAYQSMIDHLKPISSIPINKISTADIQSIVSSLSRQNPNTGKPAARETLKKLKIAAKQVFDLAIENRVIEYNPAVNLRIPANAPQDKRRALTDIEIQRIEEMPHRAQTAAMIMLYAGLRRGEVLALTWPDIDLDQNTIRVNKAVEMKNGKPFLKEGAKTASGNRTVFIPQKLTNYLRSVPKNHLLVCPNSYGRLMSSSSWRSLWNSYLCDMNRTYGDFSKCLRTPANKHMPKKIPMVIEPFTAHFLRHTYATMLYFSGVDLLTAREQLGHNDIKTTLAVYTHLDQRYKRKNIDKLNDFINNTGKIQVQESKKHDSHAV